MMERIKEIWNQLEGDTSIVAGLFKQRYLDVSMCDAFLGIKYPENYRILIIRAPFGIGKDFNFIYEFRGLKFEKIYDPDNADFLLLNLVLVDSQYKDVFDSLLEDVLRNIINETDIKTILRNYTNRLMKWQNLFERFNQQGLTLEEQRGLFGELFFLRKSLQNTLIFLDIINSWVGPENEIHDFQSGSWSVEVKTTHGNNHQKIHISSERQLDIANLKNLFLYHLSLDSRWQSGETLNQMVNSILQILTLDYISLNRFKSKLLEGGYFDQHRHLYEDVGYFIRKETFYKVENDFPRIEEKDIRKGVGDVKYSIIISQGLQYIKTEQEVFQIVSYYE